MTRLFIPDIEALRRKLACPPPILAGLYLRFQKQLTADPGFRRHHVFLPALLGDETAISEAKGILLEEACDPLRLAGNPSAASTPAAQDVLDGHIWCVAPRAMRLAAYFTWMDAQGAWTLAERDAVATGVIDFFYAFVVPVLRARTPAGHNQQLSMVLCSAIAGSVFAQVPATAGRARALRDYALPKLRQTLGLMKRDGYCGEGSTYQSAVVSGLAMWAGWFLTQLGDPGAWTRTWGPNGASLSDSLRMEADLGSPGGLLPPWDHYGWEKVHNLAARTLWATLSGHHELLKAADSVWDRPSFLAWRPDDRLWTLIGWPETEEPEALHPKTGLSGWSRPSVGAAIDHLPRKMRVMMAWDSCSGSLQGLGRAQVNPNHLMIDVAGEPLTGDGTESGATVLFSPAAMERTLAALSDSERELVIQQYGSFRKWVCTCQQGFLGAACAVVVDEWDSYFPRGTRRGRLVFEQRSSERHTFAADSAAYYQPTFDVTRMRRTVSVGVSGVIWVVDDIHAQTSHRFSWRAWFRPAIKERTPHGLRLRLPSGVALAVAWTAEADGAEGLAPVVLTPAPTFPGARTHLAWPDEGSVRCDVATSGRRVRFVTCMVPSDVEGLQVSASAPSSWEAAWKTGRETFSLPTDLLAELGATTPTAPELEDVETLCDLDEPPFALLDETTQALLASLADPPKRAWRRTTAAMQTLTARNAPEAMPAILALLGDASQNYTVHAVAAWCLGHARYAPALEGLRKMSGIPEENTAARARWAVERMKTEDV